MLLRSVLATVLVWTLATQAIGADFIRGDGNGDGFVDIGDTIFTLQYLFPQPGQSLLLICPAAVDSNGDGVLNIADAVNTLAYLFGQIGLSLPAPFPDCGPESNTSLGCLLYTACTPGPYPPSNSAIICVDPPTASGAPGTTTEVGVRLVVDAGFAVTALSFGLCHPASGLSVVSCQAGATAAQAQFDAVQCSASGVTMALVVDFSGQAPLPGLPPYHLLDVTYQLVGPANTNQSLSFCDTIGPIDTVVVSGGVRYSPLQAGAVISIQ